METWIWLLLIVHIAAGFVALVVAPGAMATRKGGLWHRRWGKIYFWSMAVVSATAVVLASARGDRGGLFLLLVAVFSFYLAFDGYRVLTRKRPDRGDGPVAIDWIAVGLVLSGSAVLIFLGLIGVFEDLGIVAVVFGGIGAILGGADVVRFLRPPTDRKAWLYTHMTSMLAAYIATVSAFSVVNLTFLPPVVRWLWPTLVGTPLIVVWVMSYRRTLSVRRRTSAVSA